MALPAGTLLYVRAETPDHDHIVARDLKSGKERIVTDLTGDGSSGWEIRGYSLSPDRTRIALASNYGPTKEDNATMLATRRIWSLAVDGTDFQRLTPVFPNDSQGRKNYSIEIEAPMWNADGTKIVYEFGNYWFEGTTLKGGSLPWSVSSQPGHLPSSFPTNVGCSVLNPARNPKTGELLFRHSVCVNSNDEGLFLYPAAGGAPKKLVAQAYGPGLVDPSLETAGWAGDGSAFAFVGTTPLTRNNTTEQVRSLFVYDMSKATFTPIVEPPSGSYVQDATVAPDSSAIVYCLREGDAYNLHLIDLTGAQATDTAITTDGKSCHPVM